ncbi:MAG: hypothetical protein NVS3B25_16930 [Hymenobacter sp.]
MDTNKKYSLENFVERHRADFDTHEPRPDLWAALEQQLAESVAGAPTVGVRPPGPAGGGAPGPAGWLQRYGVAAALALLVLAAGASEAWKAGHKAPDLAAARLAGSVSLPDAYDAALYQGGNSLALSAADHSSGADSQLVRAVRGMEAYYTNQLARRQSELRQLSGPGLAGMTADWRRELVALDSSYRKLKLELPHHPQPDAVLTAMNRNLQIRLDILDQQLHLITPTEADPNSAAYVLADSRRQPE